MEIYIKGLRMCRGIEHKHHSTQAQRREAQLPEESGPIREEKNDKPKPKDNQTAQNPRRPTLEDQGRLHNKIGLKVLHLGCGHTHGAGAPLVSCLEPNLVRVVQTASLWSVHVVMAVKSMLRHWFAPSIWEWGIFQRTPSSPPIKGGPLPPYSNNAQVKKSKARARARASPPHGLSPS